MIIDKSDVLLPYPQRYEIIRAYSKIVYFQPPDSNTQFYEFKSHIIQALSEINGETKTRNVYILSDENLCAVFNINNGSCHSSIMTDDPMNRRVGATLGEVSRFAMAWWEDPQATFKAVRLFGDRINITNSSPVIPRLFSFGIKNYNLVYPDSKYDPTACTRCNQKFDFTNANNIHFLENPHCFLCNDCKYLFDTGFLPGSASKKSQIAARRSSN